MLESMNNKIQSTWDMEKGYWNAKLGTWTNRTVETFQRTLTLEIQDSKYPTPDRSPPKKVLHFHGGPTGYESYYLEDLYPVKDQLPAHLCICGGTINRWPRCTVSRTDVTRFIEHYLGQENKT